MRSLSIWNPSFGNSHLLEHCDANDTSDRAASKLVEELGLLPADKFIKMTPVKCQRELGAIEIDFFDNATARHLALSRFPHENPGSHEESKKTKRKLDNTLTDNKSAAIRMIISKLGR